MIMGKLKGFFLLSFMTILVFSQGPFVAAAEPIEEVQDLIKQYYVEDVPDSILSKPTIKEITDQLDPYSVYMSKQEFDSFSNTINQEFVGIGVVIEEHKQGIKILQVIPNGPAEQAGLVAGDIITHVNGISLQGESVQKAISYITGAANSSVTITFIQAETGETLIKTLVRKAIVLPNVEVSVLGGQIGYIRLNSFSMDAADKIQSALHSLIGVKGYIFDLRDNGGGYVSAAQDVMGLFPNMENAFQLRDRTGIPEVYGSIQQTTQFTAPVHILINENSASASEMVAASVKEQEGAKLYGQTSYGKGSMQGLFTLSDGGVLKLTIAKFYSPQGTEINGIGVNPNVATEVGQELTVSHRDQLLNLYKSYKKLPSLTNVPTTKTFTVKMNKETKWETISPQDVQLINLGGRGVEIELMPIDDKTIQVKPKELLHSGESYILLIHPNWKGKDNTAMKLGNYLEVSVK